MSEPRGRRVDTANLLGPRAVFVALRDPDLHPRSHGSRLPALRSARRSQIWPTIPAVSYGNGYALPSERQLHVRLRGAYILRRSSFERRVCLERTDIAPDQLKMINNPPICKIAIYSAQARQPNLRNTAVKTVPGEASAVPVSAWAKRGRALRSSYGRAGKRAVAAAARQGPRLLLLLDFGGDFDYRRVSQS